MRSVQEMISLEIHQPLKKNLKTIFEHKYSRYPVFDKKLQSIIGIIHVKDLFTAFYNKEEIASLKPFIRPILKVSSDLPALNLLRKFREGMPHFALVYERRNQLKGFITLDNLLHILVGRIKDEFHKTQDDWIVNKDGTLTIKGSCSIYTLERALDIDIPLDENEEDEIHTISDLILSQLQVPKKGDRAVFDRFELEVERIEKEEILKVKVSPRLPY
jgi:CBS domain containing-hemolysin-like protein